MLVMNKNQLEQFLELLTEAYQVLVPAECQELTQYAPYELVKNGQAKLLLDSNTTVSPKGLFLPQSEALYAFQAQGKKLALAVLPTDITRPRLVFPMRHCDVKGVQCLDKVFLDPQYTDAQYQEKRDNTTIMALMCGAPKDSCFCQAMGVDPVHAEASVADVQVYDLGDSYGFTALNDKGREALAPVKSLLTEKEAAVPAPPAQKLQPKTEGLPEKLSGMFYDPIWDNFMFKCIGCGTCTFVCPTCYCFDLSSKLRGEQGVKLRTWDSCMFNEYTLMAGGHQPRPGKKERVRNRFLHKLEYFYENHGMLLCTGCGRCLRKCPMNIDIVKFIGQVNG